MKKIDINCDLGESFGTYTLGQDELIMPYISSANIACGFHAGDPHIISRTIELALQHNVQIGAHPGFPDLIGFGRREMVCSPKEIYDLVLYQVAAVQGMCQALGGAFQHVKPHGALYNLAAREYQYALAIAEAVYALAPDAVLFGLADSELTRAGEHMGLTVAHEGFADRTYQANGALTPRTEEEAVIHTLEDAIQQVMDIAAQGKVTAVSGEEIKVQIDTICIHGDHSSTPALIKKLNETLPKMNVQIEAVSKWKEKRKLHG